MNSVSRVFLLMCLCVSASISQAASFIDKDKQSAVFDVNTIQWSIYPNPAGRSLAVTEFSEGFQYTISSIQGKIVQSGILKQTLSVEELIEGVYILSIYMPDGQRTSKKFIKQGTAGVEVSE